MVMGSLKVKLCDEIGVDHSGSHITNPRILIQAHASTNANDTNRSHYIDLKRAMQHVDVPVIVPNGVTDLAKRTQGRFPRLHTARSWKNIGSQVSSPREYVAWQRPNLPIAQFHPFDRTSTKRLAKPISSSTTLVDFPQTTTFSAPSPPWENSQTIKPSLLILQEAFHTQ